MREAREAIARGEFAAFAERRRAAYPDK